MSSNSSSIVISFSIAILLLLVLLILVSYNSKCKMDKIERFENDAPSSQQLPPYLSAPFLTGGPSQNKHIDGFISVADIANANADVSKASDGSMGYAVQSSDAHVDNFASVSTTYNPNELDNNTCFSRDRLTSSDLLPKDGANSKWAQINPATSGDMRDQNFLTAGYHIGINTIGQSLRNANLQLRSEPPNPQVAVSPWGISTIEPDIRKVAFEIGSGQSN